MDRINPFSSRNRQARRERRNSEVAPRPTQRPPHSQGANAQPAGAQPWGRVMLQDGHHMDPDTLFSVQEGLPDGATVLPLDQPLPARARIPANLVRFNPAIHNVGNQYDLDGHTYASAGELDRGVRTVQLLHIGNNQFIQVTERNPSAQLEDADTLPRYEQHQSDPLLDQDPQLQHQRNGSAGNRRAQQDNSLIESTAGSLPIGSIDDVIGGSQR